MNIGTRSWSVLVATTGLVVAMTSAAGAATAVASPASSPGPGPGASQPLVRLAGTLIQVADQQGTLDGATAEALVAQSIAERLY